MRGLIVASLLLLAVPGWAAELARPVLFADEPVAVITAAHAPAPKLEFCGLEFQVSWSSRPVAAGLRWEGTLPSGAPLGVWTVSTPEGCSSFLRIPTGWAVLELVGAVGADLVAPGLSLIHANGAMLAIGPAGDWRIQYAFPGQANSHTLTNSLSPHEWRRVVVGELSLSSSTPAALPGHDLLIKATVFSPVDVATLNEALRLPPGWTARPIPCSTCPPEMDEPIPAGVRTVRAWLVHVPHAAPTGRYEVAATLPGTGITGSVEIEVVNLLPVWVVVAHWDTETDDLDLTLDQGITYEQLLWAASLLGQEVPYTGRTMTQEVLDRLARLWQAGGDRSGP